ncbi:DsrE family protein [Oleiagrimonas sp. MCCC 1A03011]|uniref:DsrE family protein n=1 Tax=Oleiagrimonas sp. MCCC 1A03011 TaxID=1926883 RepID=UPI000DC57D5E|nr:DsrE family protein [Oleiagrimonas sp. MCCC 1A03011]RAP57540.1 hypothetical protein BTJ49_10110 [Oleiagrimonas sp. MCCC 1A03011]
MNIGKSGRSVLVALALCAFALPSLAAEHHQASKHKAAEVSWIHPVIAKFGGVHPRTDVDMQPNPAVDYKVFVDVVSANDDPGKMSGSLDRLARLVNLMGFAKVPSNHVHIVALLEGKATPLALDNATYRKLFKHDNPNLAVLHALKKAGVKLMICSQAMAGHGIKDDQIDSAVTITLSALTDTVIYGHRGYSYMQL